jgi:hypothetical protein
MISRNSTFASFCTNLCLFFPELTLSPIILCFFLFQIVPYPSINIMSFFRSDAFQLLFYSFSCFRSDHLPLASRSFLISSQRLHFIFLILPPILVFRLLPYWLNNEYEKTIHYRRHCIYILSYHIIYHSSMPNYAQAIHPCCKVMENRQQARVCVCVFVCLCWCVMVGFNVAL